MKVQGLRSLVKGRAPLWHGLAGLDRRRLAAYSIIALAGLVVAWVVVAVFVPRHLFSTRAWHFEISEGERLRRVARRLEEDGLVRSEFLFRAVARLRGADKHIHSGEYRLGCGWSSWRILGSFVRGDVYLHRLKVREGADARTIAAELDGRGLSDVAAFLRLVNDPERARELGVACRGLEGYLFPDTYHLPRGIPAAKLAAMMVERYRAKRPPDLDERAGALGLKPSALVILASIIEKEARVPEERPVISAVFHNRLRRKMRLESCATVRYLVGYERERLLERDLAIQSPYNTYLRRGLPPGPICNPGLEALQAAAHPAEVDYLYFVARGDGGHEFSLDYEAHLAAKKRYQSGGGK